MSFENRVRETYLKDLSVSTIMQKWGIGRSPARQLRATADGLGFKPAPVDILVVGDQHVTPGGPTEHFDWLAAYIQETRPQVVVNIGDTIDNASFSFHTGDAEKAKYSYVEELDAGIDAWAPAVSAAEDVGARMVYCEGNHGDVRMRRFFKKNPWMKGAIREFSPMMEKAGWEVHKFQEPALVNGIHFAHYFCGGVMAKPIGGVNTARNMALKVMDSCIAGHSHMYEVRTTTTPLGRRLLTGHVGCFIHPDSTVSEWAGPQAEMLYSRGIVHIRRAIDGHGDVEWVSMERLQETYG